MKLKSWKSAPWKAEAEKLLPVLKSWQKTVAPLNQMHDLISDCFGFSGSGKFQSCFDALEKSINEMPAILCGDNAKWLEWYRFENNMGQAKKPVSLSKTDTPKPVENLFDLAVILTAPNEL